MLESLGYAPAAERADADLILFNTCSIREAADNRFIAHLGEAKRLKSEDPERVVGVGGCWAQSVKDEVFERFPFVDVAFGPGQIAPPGRVPRLRLAHRPGLLRVRGLLRAPADEARARVPGLAADLPGLQLPLLVLHRALDPRARAEPRRRPSWSPRSRRLAADGVREVTLLGQNVNSYGRDLPADADELRRAAGDGRRGRRDRADPLHQPAPQGHARGRDPRPRRAAGALRAHPPAAAVGLEPDPEGDAAHLRPRALPRPGRADPRARARLRPDHRHHRRLPGRDRGRLRRRRSRSSSEVGYDGAFTFVFSPRRGTEAATLGDQVPHAVKRERMERLVEAVQRRARERAQRFVGRTMEVLVEGPSRTDPAALRGRTRHNKTVNFDGTAAPGELVEVEIDAATSTDALRARAPAQPRRLSRRVMRSSRSSGRPRSARPGSRSRSPSCCASAARTRSRSPATRSRSTRGSRSSAGRRRGRAARGSSTGWSASCRSTRSSRAGRFADLAHAEIDQLLAEGRRPIVVGGTGLYMRAALAELELRPPVPSEVRAEVEADLAARGPRGAARRARAGARLGGASRTTASGSPG